MMYNNCTTNLWCEKLHTKYQLSLGESPGLVVMGGESCSEVHRFESHYHILDGQFFTYICCKIVIFV